MSEVQPVNAMSVAPNRATYNAVKIRIEEPKLNIPDKKAVDNTNDTGEYSAVNIEVTKPEIAPQKKDVEDIPKYSIYDYPMADGIITYNQLRMVDYTPYKALPADEDMIEDADNSEIETTEEDAIALNDNNDTDDSDTDIASKISINEVLVGNENQGDDAVDVVDVPAPNFTTTENEKASDTGLNFHGLNFKAEKPNVVPAADMKPKTDIKGVSSDLASDNYDTQALALERIATTVMNDKANANVYITSPIFSNIINIITKDTSALAGPTQEQMDIREKIIANSIELIQAKNDNKTLGKSDLPYQLTDDEIAKATELSELEMAERNKEYAMITLAGLAAVYADEFQKQTGNVVPLTDLPGASNLVDVLKTSKNPSLKITALEALLFLQRPEYNDELKAVMTIAAQDKNPVVAKNAALGLSILNNNK